MKWLDDCRMRIVLAGFVAAIVVGGGSARADFTFGEPVNLGQPVNSLGADVFDCLSADGLEIYFDRTNLASIWLWDIWVAKRPTIDDDWGAPVNLGSNINTPDRDEVCASISADGLELYFGRGHPDQGIDVDLYVTTRETTNDEWLPAVRLGEPLNSSADEGSPSISADGLSLYFSSDRSGGEGSTDLYVTTRQTKNHAWSTPVNLGPTVNSSSTESFPSITADSLLLMFSSDRPGNYSSPYDLWMTKRRTTSDPWGEPINLGPMINTDDVDFAGISPNGRTLYLSCYGRPGGYRFYDIWQAPIIPIVDFNGDSLVEIGDLVMLIDNWGTTDSLCDIGPTPFGDGVVDAADLEVLMSYWGQDAYDPYDPTLIAHWKLDETEGVTACDSVLGCDGIVSGDPAWESSGGQVDGALRCDGVDDYVSTPFILDPGEGPFSIYAWVKGGAPGQVIVSQADGVSWLMADTSAGTLATELVPPAGRFLVPPLVSDVAITDGIWHRVAFVWDGASRSLYVDGTLVAQDEQSSLAESHGVLNIGCGQDMATGSFFSGLIDDVRIYKRAVEP